MMNLISNKILNDSPVLSAIAVAGIVVLTALFLFAGLADAVNPNSGTTTTDQDLNVEITTDPASDPVWLGTTVEADAAATLGEGDFANVMYVVDISGSMENNDFNPFQPVLGDCDGDGIDGTTLDAACLGLIALNQSLGSPTNVNVGLAAFGDGAKTADMSPAGGAQTFTTPPDADVDNAGGPDVEQVIKSLTTEFGGDGAAGIGLFTADVTDGFAFETNYNAALSAMNVAFAGQPPGGTNITFFLSDGEPTTFTTGAGSPLQDAVDAETTIHTFAIGTIAPGACAVGEPLQTIADQTGGTCTEVADPSDLSTVLPVALTNIQSLDLKVNGITVCSEAGSEPVSMSIANCDITSELAVGMNTIEAVATAEDGTVVTADIQFGVIDLELTPATDTNDLGAGDDTHTVTATVHGDPSQIQGIPIDFVVGGQNAGAEADGVCSPNADCTSDATGVVMFTYTVPVEAASLGIDTISASATVNDDTETREVEKEWVDETPPVAECVETTNPAGNNTPSAPAKGGQGQNQDGFYQLLGSDLLGIASIVVADDGSAFVSDPFADGDKVKVTQAPGTTPSDNRPGPGVIVSHLKLNGDAIIRVTDNAGNITETSCLVPPPPK